jgi:hypothetical protein
VYELHVTSFRAADVEWKRLEVLSEDGHPLASYSGAELEKLLTRPGAAGVNKEPRRIGAGLRAVAFLWIPLDGSVPSRIHHRAAFTIPASVAGVERLVDGADVSVRPSPVVIGPPVRGGSWVARWIGETSFHRRGLMSVDGGAKISQRFAIDWNRFASDGREWRGEGTVNTDYSVYGQDVIAVADSVVAKVVDAIPENVPGSMNPRRHRGHRHRRGQLHLVASGRWLVRDLRTSASNRRAGVSPARAEHLAPRCQRRVPENAAGQDARQWRAGRPPSVTSRR